MRSSSDRLATWVSLLESVLYQLRSGGVTAELSTVSSPSLVALRLVAKRHMDELGEPFGYSNERLLDELRREPAASTEEGAALLSRIAAALDVVDCVQLSQWADHVWEYDRDLEEIERRLDAWVAQRRRSRRARSAVTQDGCSFAGPPVVAQDAGAAPLSRGTAEGLDELLKQLPLNRKERFYTGTVFPAIVGADEFAHLHRFLELVHLPAMPVTGDPLTTRMLFFTEYGLKESMLGGQFDALPEIEGRDTPDIVIYFAPDANDDGALIGIEAKMFHRPSKAALETQLAVQRTMLEGIARSMQLPPPVLVALLPAPLRDRLGTLAAPTVTISWEDIADTFRDCAPEYWIGMLDQARDRYKDLASSDTVHAEAHLTGLEILAQSSSGSAEYRWMGRQGGLHGTALEADFDQLGAWRERSYQVRTTPPPGTKANWFEIRDFTRRAQAWVDRTEGAHSTPNREPDVQPPNAP
jgi:hypothetical protein